MSKKIETMMMTDAIEDFRQKCERGEVVNTRTGEIGCISDGMRDVILSTVRAAAKRAGGTCDLRAIPFGAVAQMLDRHAREDAIEHGRGLGNTEAARATRFVRTVLGIAPKRRRAHAHHFFPGWRPLAEALDRRAAREGVRPQKGYLHRLMELASAKAQVTAPEDLPDRTTLEAWVSEEGIKRGRWNKMLSVYRLARAEILAEDSEAAVPDLDAAPLAHEHGIRGLPIIIEVAREIGHDGPLNRLDTLAALKRIAPVMHAALTDYIDHSRAMGQSAAWEEGVVQSVSRAVASAYRTGTADLSTLQPADLFLQTVTVHGGVAEATSYQKAILHKYGGAEMEQVSGARKIPLLQRLCEEMAHHAAENSPTILTRDVLKNLREEDVPFYAQSLQTDVFRLSSLAIWTLEPLAEANPDLLKDVCDVRRILLRHMADVNRKRNVARTTVDRSQSLELISYPLIVCMGLPALAKRVRILRDRYFAAVERHGGDLAKEAVRSAEQRFDSLLTQYVVTAFYVADGLREKNYSYARVGAPGVTGMMRNEHGEEIERTLTHIWPEIDPETGQVIAVRTQFSGGDHRLPRLKVRQETNRKTRHRVWHIRPGILDMDLFTEYLLGTRVRNLVRQGLVEHFEGYSIEKDLREWNYALFTSPEPSEHVYRRITGCYSEHKLAPLVKASLHWMAKHACGHTDLPDLDCDEWKEQYKHVLTGHYTRSAIASYWICVRGNVELACKYTNDTEKMLRDRYAVVSQADLDAEFIGQPRWRNPRFWDDAIDRIWRGDVIDWDKESPVLKLPARERPPLV